jgi:very-short-patch-repair endonuclease
MVGKSRGKPLWSASSDSAIADLAGKQHGVVTRTQLIGAGVTARSIERRLETSRLHAVRRGVYLVGHAAHGPLSRQMAAVLACGPTAVLSHRSAAAHWGLLDYRTDRGDVWVTATGKDRSAPAGVRLVRVARFEQCDRRVRDRIPVTSPPRTLLDLGSVVDERRLERAVAEAYVKGLASEGKLLDQLARNPGKRGRGALRALLERNSQPALTESEAERMFLDLIRQANLPEPEVNARLGTRVVDFLWRRERVIAEVDGFAFHSHVKAFGADRQRTNDLQLAGYMVLRFTWHHIVREPLGSVARLRRALTTREPMLRE